ncbi:MAG TPA: helix-turn-helix domain-containing protein, partial [Streptosporangiaceae bacterium]
EITTAPAWRGRVPPGVLAGVAARILEFSDEICIAVTAAHTDECTQVTRGPEYRRSALLSAILADPDPDHVTAPEELSLPHCAAVAQVRPDLPLDQMEEIGRALVRQVGGLWTIRYGTVVAAIPLPVPAGRDTLRQRLAGLLRAGTITAIGIGGMSASAADTRVSYREAVSALDIGSRLGPGGHPVYEYQLFAPLIALMAQPDQARRFTAAALEPLGGLAARSWVLPTLEAYFARQGHLKEVAAALAVHLNTVKYRLRQLHPCIDSSLSDGDRATAMLLALRARRLLTDTGAQQAPPRRPRNLPRRRTDTHP